jgi:hypothetical protein
MNKNVLNKLSKIESKVELGAVRVDLALADDIKTMAAKALQVANDLDGAVVAADKAKAEFDKQVALVKKFYPVASKFQDAEDKLWEKATKSATDLGLKREDIPGWKEFADNGLDVNSAINGANKYMA